VCTLQHSIFHRDRFGLQISYETIRIKYLPNLLDKKPKSTQVGIIQDE
jgi:hypothetical protein